MGTQRWLAVICAVFLVFSFPASALAAPGPAGGQIFLPQVSEAKAGFTISLPLIANGASTAAVLPVANFTPNDPMYVKEWDLAKVDAARAWGYTPGSAGVIIAVLDSGIDLTHPDLVDKIRVDLGSNYVAPGASPADDNGHGTHVAGLAAATPNNGIGIAGLGGLASLMPLKILDAAGNGYFTNLAAAIQYAADHGARVINMSLGSPASANYACGTQFPYLQAAVDYAYNKGVLLVAAAGNDSSSNLVAPADCNHVLGVASTDGNDAASFFSNHGSYVAVAAPGGTSGGHSLLSTCWPGMTGINGASYCELEGTSMSAPLVSGLAALIFARYPDYTPDQVASAILDNAVDLGAAGWDPTFGCGRIDAGAALANGAKGPAPLCLANRQAVSASASAAPDRLQSFSLAGGPYAPGRLIVRWQAGLSQAEAQAVLAASGASLEGVLPGGFWSVRVAPGQEAAVMARLSAAPQITFAQPDYAVGAK